MGFGNTLKFLNILDGTELHQRAVDEYGTGISCVAGHAFYDIFAYAEYSPHSNIFICTFPQLRRICTLNSIHFN